MTLVGISVDSPEETRALAQSQGHDFPLLADQGATTIRSYGVLHEHAGEKGKDIARPAEFLIDHGGTIRWVNLAPNVLSRLRPETVLDVMDHLTR